MSYCRGALYVIQSGSTHTHGNNRWICYTCHPVYETENRLEMVNHLRHYHMADARLNPSGKDSREIFESATYAIIRLLTEHIGDMKIHEHNYGGK